MSGPPLRRAAALGAAVGLTAPRLGLAAPLRRRRPDTRSVVYGVGRSAHRSPLGLLGAWSGGEEV
jgi:hypothetical protein